MSNVFATPPKRILKASKEGGLVRWEKGIQVCYAKIFTLRLAPVTLIAFQASEYDDYNLKS